MAANSKPLPMQSTHSYDEEPDFLRNDPGLACLLSQLDRVNQQIHLHERFKQLKAEAEKVVEERKAKAATASLNDGQSRHTDHTIEWEKHWDDAVGAEYYFNPKTGEASWLPPQNQIKKK
ncbi:hypothetical protein ACHAWT_008286 [Skeletonema menzelii]